MPLGTEPRPESDQSWIPPSQSSPGAHSSLCSLPHSGHMLHGQSHPRVVGGAAGCAHPSCGENLPLNGQGVTWPCAPCPEGLAPAEKPRIAGYDDVVPLSSHLGFFISKCQGEGLPSTAGTCWNGRTPWHSSGSQQGSEGGRWALWLGCAAPLPSMPHSSLRSSQNSTRTECHHASHRGFNASPLLQAHSSQDTC